jgi:hypothetical protein
MERPSTRGNARETRERTRTGSPLDGKGAMTPKRAAAYIGGFALLAAWLASAASTAFRRDPPPAAEPRPAVASTEMLAAEIESQAERLRQRLASAPVPKEPARNPFAFRVRDLPPAAAPVMRPVDAFAAPAAPPEPALALIGVAEDRGANGPVRTAMIADDRNELFMVAVGESLMGRYQVEAIGADAIELKDLSSGSVRRLALRP